MNRRAIPAAALALLALAAAPGARAEDPDSAGDMRKEFERQFRLPGPERKAAAFRLLDVTTADCLPSLYEGFRVRHWLVRGAAALGASRVPDGPLRSQLRLDLLRHEDALVRGGIAYALAAAPVPGDGEALAGALEDANGAVRRDAARGIGRIPTREGIDALLRSLRRETDARVRVWVLDSLRGVARGDPGDWEAWWKVHRDDPAFRRNEEEASRKDMGGVPLEVVTVPARRAAPEDPAAAKRPELFVLAPFGWTHDVFRPHLDALEELFAVSYVRLPSIRELTGLTGYGDQVGVYPADRLARALEALRRERGADRVILLADGAACWIAESYAAAYPRSAAGLVLVNGWIDAASYAGALERLSRSADPDERAAADSLRGTAPGPRDPAEDRWLGRVFLTQRLADRADLFAHHLWMRARDPQGFAAVPGLRLDRRRRIETPTLFVFPGGSPLSGHPDGQRVRDAFPNGILAVMDDTKGFPFVDMHDEFHRVVRGFVERYRLDR